MFFTHFLFSFSKEIWLVVPLYTVRTQTWMVVMLPTHPRYLAVSLILYTGHYDMLEHSHFYCRCLCWCPGYLCLRASAWCLLLISVNAHCPGTCCVNSAAISSNYITLKETRPLLIRQFFFLLPLSHRQHPEFNQILCCISSQIQMLHAIKQAQNGFQRRKSNTPFHRNNWLAQYFIGVVITSSCTLTDTSCLLMKSASSGKPLPSQIVFGSGGKGILKYDYFWSLSCPGPISLPLYLPALLLVWFTGCWDVWPCWNGDGEWLMIFLNE